MWLSVLYFWQILQQNMRWLWSSVYITHDLPLHWSEPNGICSTVTADSVFLELTTADSRQNGIRRRPRIPPGSHQCIGLGR